MITKQSIDQIIQMMEDHNIRGPYQMQGSLTNIKDVIAVMSHDFVYLDKHDATLNHMLHIQKGSFVIGKYKDLLYLVAIAIPNQQC